MFKGDSKAVLWDIVMAHKHVFELLFCLKISHF